MAIGISTFVGVVGAVVRYAVTASVAQHSFDIQPEGVIRWPADWSRLTWARVFRAREN